MIIIIYCIIAITIFIGLLFHEKYSSYHWAFSAEDLIIYFAYSALWVAAVPAHFLMFLCYKIITWVKKGK